jgi:hypothetical protein
MPITETDIKLLKSARMTDTPDGGGRMTGNVVQSGADNNLFDDVSSLDRVHGSVSLRKMFAGVLTNNTDKYLGARVIIDRPAADPYLESTLFGASSLFDVRDAAKQRVEAYLAPGSPYQGLLYGPHIVGMRVITLIQQVNRQVPTIGEVFILRKGIGTLSETDQFVRVTGVAHSELNFTDPSGDFTRRVVVCDISDALRHDFLGWETTRVDAGLDYAGKTRVFESVVADAAQYYGIRPLVAAASVGDFTIQADSAYSQLLPSAQIETPIADASAAGYALAAQAVGSDFTFDVSATLSTTQKLFIGSTVARGTLSIASPSLTTAYTDDGAGNLVAAGVPIGVVDYQNGVVSLADAAYNITASFTITYRVAATPSLVLRSTGIQITLENRSLSFVLTLSSAPAKGTLTVSYMVAGQWYVLRDKGNGALAADEAGFGAGNINYTTQTLAVTLGALPDVGGTVVVQWGERDASLPISGADLGVIPRVFFEYMAPELGAVQPNSGVTLAWSYAGSNFSAAYSNGLSTGDADLVPLSAANGQWTGMFRVHPHRIPPVGTVLNLSYVAATQQTVPNVSVLAFGFGAAVVPKSVRVVGVHLSFSFALSGLVNGAEPRMNFSSFSFEPRFTVAAVGTDSSQTGTGLFTLFDVGTGELFATYYTTGAGWTSFVVGSVDYATGAVVVNGSITLPANAGGPDVFVKQGTDDWGVLAWQALPSANRTATVSVAAQSRQARYTAVGGTTVNRTVTPATYHLAPNIPALTGTVVRNLGFTLAGKVYAQDKVQVAQLVSDMNPLTGVGVQRGTVDPYTGLVTLTAWPAAGPDSTVTAFAASRVPVSAVAEEGNRFLSSEIVFRTPTAPLRPGGFSVLGTLADGTTFNLAADANGKIDNARVAGVVNYQTGVCRLWAKEVRPDWQSVNTSYAFSGYYLQVMQSPSIYRSLEGFRTGTVRYNAVAFNYLPLDAEILGLDPVRLPSDGRVPVFKAGRVVVVHNTQPLAAQAVSNGQTVSCGRTLLARIRVMGADGLEVTSGFSKNLDAGTITFTNTAGMSQPVTIEHRIEDEALCADAQINGQLRLTRPLTHAYPTAGTYVSSAYVVGTLQAAAQDSFSQETWTAAWSDSRIGNPVLAQYDDTANPFVVTNAGAITERWAIIFQSNTAFSLVGEEVGQIITGDTATLLAPVNPATGVPYFTLQPAGWGLGWAAGNVLRFNTTGANFPLWVARTVRQSPAAPPGSDQINISVRGDIDQ